MRYPLDKIYITQKFGERPEYYARYGMKGHNGIDFRTRFVDSPRARRYVVSALDGVVEVIRYDRVGYGTHIRIRHNDRSLTIYAHLSKVYVSIGQRVNEGQRIGLTGNTGDSSGPHLHFEYRPAGWERHVKNGYYGAIDPLPILEGRIYDPGFAKKWDGRLILDVEDKGKVYYIFKGKRIFMHPKISKDLAGERIDGKYIITGFRHEDVVKIPLWEK